MATKKKDTDASPEEEVSPKAAPKKKAACTKKSPCAKKTTAASEAKPACKKKAPCKKNTEKAAVTEASEELDAAAKVEIIKESLTPEEKARLAKLKECLKIFKADPEWSGFLKEQTEALLDLRAALLPNMNSVTREHLRSGASNESSSSGQHIGDAGSEAEVRDLTIRLLDKDREQLFEIDAALDRIRRGTYGVCEISLLPIPKGRLRVRPFCRLTVKCQEEFEKKHGTASLYRTPESDIIGYAGAQNDGESIISLDEDE